MKAENAEAIKIEYAFLARSAEVLADGTFTVIGGGIDRFICTNFPPGIPTLVLVVRLSVARDEWNKQHDLLVEIFGPDGELMPGQRHTLTFNLPPAASAPQLPGLVGMLTLVGMQFPRPGIYRIRLSVGSKELDSISLYFEQQS
jgi:hypothetical protein